MNFFANMHPVSVVVIVMILMLFFLSVVLLMTVSTSYRKQKKLATVGDTHRSALVRDVLQEFTAAYNTFGQETNTPAIITSVIHEDMSFFLFCERFLNNAVFDVQRKLAGALLGCTPAHTVGVSADILDLISLGPLALLGNGSRAMVRALGNRAHIGYLLRTRHNHSLLYLSSHFAFCIKDSFPNLRNFIISVNAAFCKLFF